jgi:hypothetical protein
MEIISERVILTSCCNVGQTNFVAQGVLIFTVMKMQRYSVLITSFYSMDFVSLDVSFAFILIQVFDAYV